MRRVFSIIIILAMMLTLTNGFVGVKKAEAGTLGSTYIKFTTNPAGNTYSPTDTFTVSWDVEGFTGTEGKIKIFFFNATNPGNWSKWVEVTPSGGLDIADDSYLIDLSQFQIEDPLRCKLRIGISTPSGWLKWSDGTYSGTYFDETGYFEVIDLDPLPEI